MAALDLRKAAGDGDLDFLREGLTMPSQLVMDAEVSAPSVGDEALTLNTGANAAQSYVRKGTIGFELLLGGQYIDTQPDLGLAQEKALAAAVRGRL